MPAATLDLIHPTWWACPDYDRTLGPEVAQVAELAGFVPDPEQRLLLDATFAFGPRNRSIVRDVGVCAPRQNLKTGFLKMCALGWLYVTEQPLTVWSAHEFGTAQEAFRDMCNLIEGSPDLDAEVLAVHRANGSEAIELKGNRRLRFKARTKAGGRGLTGNKIVLDEAMYLTNTHMGALVPTLRAVPDPQLILAGSAGMETADVWRAYRDRGRAGDTGLVWAEWGDPHPDGCTSVVCDHLFGRDGCALDDQDRWRATNTAIGRRISIETLAHDRASLDAAEFARETLGWWEDPPAGGGVFDIDEWLALAVGNQPMTRPVLSVEVAPDRSTTLIAAAWRVEGRPHLEVVEERPGVVWVIERVAELVGRYDGITTVIDGDSEARGLETPLTDIGVRVTVLKSADRPVACAGFHDLATSGGLRHNGDPAMSAALAAARWKDVGDGMRVFSRRKSAGDIRVLYALALAVWALGNDADYDLMASIG